MASTFEAVYADGWDRGVVNPLTRSVAQARDGAGEPYTVVLVVDDRLHTVVDVSWRDGYCGVSRFDAAGRQVSCHELRATADGDLFLRQVRTWTGPPDLGDDEFPHVAARHTTTYRTTGQRVDVDEPRGDRGSRRNTFTKQPAPRLPIPAFGQWQALLHLAEDGHVTVTDAQHNPLPVRIGPAPPWRPPRPLQPDGIEELFIAGTERLTQGRRVRMSSHAVGTLCMPSGQLVADGPESLEFGVHPFAVTVPPGTYRVTVSIATFVDEPDHHQVTAARLDITDRPVTRWELALRKGQDPADLGEGQFFGFGVDIGMACFADAEACNRLLQVWEELDLADPPYTVVGDGDMVAWSSGGDGSYPTWIGRDDNDTVACFIADMLLFPPKTGKTTTEPI